MIPLFRDADGRSALRDAIRNVGLTAQLDPFWNVEDWWLEVALAAAIAVSLLAVSGAGGSGVQTPKRGGTVVFGPVGEPPCLNPLVGRAATFPLALSPRRSSRRRSPLLPTSPGSHSSSRARRTRRSRPFTITYRIRPEARWSDGVPVTARDFVFTHNAIRKLLARPRLQRSRTSTTGCEPSARSTRRPSESSFAPAKRAGGASSAPFCRGTRSAARTSRASGAMTSTTPRRGSRSGAAPSSSRAGSAASNSRSSATATTGGHTSRISTGSSCASGRAWGYAPARGAGSAPPGRARLRVHAGTPPSSPTFGECRGSGSSTRRPRAGSTSTSGPVPEGIPRSEDKRVRRAIAYGIDRVAIARRLFGELDPRYRPSDSAVFLANHDVAIGRTGPSTATAPRSRDGCSSSRAAGAGPTASTSARDGGSSSVSSRPRGRAAGAHDRARPGPAPAGRHRGRPSTSSRRDGALLPGPPQRRLRPRLLHLERLLGEAAGRISSAAAARTTTAATARGW